MIEVIILNYLKEKTGVPVYAEIPENPPDEFIIIEKTGGGGRVYLQTAVFAIQSYSTSLYSAMLLNHKVKAAMNCAADELENIFRSDLNSDYNFTDTTLQKNRYQAVYDLTYYEED